MEKLFLLLYSYFTILTLHTDKLYEKTRSSLIINNTISPSIFREKVLEIVD